MSSLVGQSLDGRYLLKRVVCEGKRTLVYEGQNAVTNRLVAVKMLATERLHDPKARRALLEEARLLNAAEHPCVAQVLDAGTAELDDDKATTFVVMELVEGRTLEGVLAANSQLDVAEVLRIGIGMLRALDWMHRLGVVHGALNPRHVLLPALHPADRDWDIKPAEIKIVGFGDAARATIDEQRGTPAIADAAYLSPEQIAGETASHRSDLYGTASILYQALTGDQVKAKNAPDARDKRSDVPDGMADALVKALQRDPEARPSTAQELGEALQRTKRKLPPPKPAAETKRRRDHLRAPYITPIRVMKGEWAADGRCEDISIAGMLVVSAVAVPKDAKVAVRFALPGTSRFVDEPATVRWSKSKGGTSACGLSFDKLSAPAAIALDKYLEVYGRPPVPSSQS